MFPISGAGEEFRDQQSHAVSIPWILSGNLPLPSFDLFTLQSAYHRLFERTALLNRKPEAPDFAGIMSTLDCCWHRCCHTNNVGSDIIGSDHDGFTFMAISL